MTLVLLLLAQSPQLAESVRLQASACAEKSEDACKQLCDRLDLWLLSGPDALDPAPHSDVVARAWPKPARCAAAQHLWRGRAKVALGHFTRAYDAFDATEDDKIIAAAGAMLASRSLGKKADAAAWGAKFLAALDDSETVRGHDVAGARLIAKNLKP